MTTIKNNPFASFRCAEPFTTLDGVQSIKVQMDDHHGFVSPLDFIGGGSAAQRKLLDFNIVPQPATWEKITAAVRAITAFPVAPYLARPGSTPPYFALQDRTVFAPKGVAPVEAIFPRGVKSFTQAGTLTQWKRHVAEPLVGNPRAQGLVAMPFAAIISELYEGVGNCGFELVGRPAQGKSKGLMLAASVMGGVDRDDSCIISLNATANGLERVVPGFRNLLMPFEEAQLFGANDTPKARATKWREFAHRLADGSSKLRGQASPADDSAPTTSTPMWFLLNSNQSSSEILGSAETDADLAVIQRIQTIPADGKYGLWDRLPPGTIGGAAFSDAMAAAASRYHGTALPAFLQQYVDLRHENEEAMRNRIACLMEEFEQEIGLDPNDGEASRAAKAFGLLYPAIRLAQRFNVLPTSWDALAIAKRCHALNRAAVLHRRPFKDRLRAYASRPDLIRIERGKLPILSDEEVAASLGFIKERGGQVVLMMSVHAYRRAFPDWRQLKSAARQVMQFDADGQHHPKQQVRRNGPKLRLVTLLVD